MPIQVSIAVFRRTEYSDVPGSHRRTRSIRLASGGGSAGQESPGHAVSAVGEVPAQRDREALGVRRAEVVTVGFALGGELVEPDVRTAVLVGQRHGSRSSAGRPRAL